MNMIPTQQIDALYFRVSRKRKQDAPYHSARYAGATQ
jgi:hypothetical protein